MFSVVAGASAATAQLIESRPAQELLSSEKDIGAVERSSDWRPYQGMLQHDEAVVWFRQQVRLSWPDAPPANPLALSVRVNGLYEAYWDGALVGSNRHLGERAPQYSRLYLPVGELADGTHTLLIRIEGAGMKAGSNLDLLIQPSLIRAGFFGVHSTVIVTFFVAAGCLLAGLYFLTVGRGGQGVTIYRLAALITLTTGALVFLDQARFLTPYPYTWTPFVEAALAVLMIIFMAALPAYAALRLGLKRPFWWSLGLVGVIALSFMPIAGFDADVRALLWLGLFLAGLAVLAIGRHRHTSLLLLGAIAISLAALLYQPDSKLPFVATVALLFALELALNLRRQARKTQQLEVMSARLRSDLLKRNIQPHFLMNSLTALMEWIETDPDEAVAFIDKLAEEFRYLCDFADCDRVALRQELALCEAHIALMNQRLGSRMRLDNLSVRDPEAEVPPAVIHTLIENAFSHNDYRGAEGVFTLEQNERGYRLSVPVIKARDSTLQSGLGTRYIEARMEEFCGGAFRFTSERLGSQWVSTLQF